MFFRCTLVKSEPIISSLFETPCFPFMASSFSFSLCQSTIDLFSLLTFCSALFWHFTFSLKSKCCWVGASLHHELLMALIIASTPQSLILFRSWLSPLFKWMGKPCYSCLFPFPISCPWSFTNTSHSWKSHWSSSLVIQLMELQQLPGAL